MSNLLAEMPAAGGVAAGADGVRAVVRALDILMAFSVSDRELTVAELLQRVDLSRPTLYRLLHTLEQSGFVSASGEPQRFRLGPAVAHLAHVWSAGLDIAALAAPMMQRLWERTGETVAVFVPQGGLRVCIAEIPSAQPLSFRRGVGYRESLLRGASGRVILAHAGARQAAMLAQASEQGGPIPQPQDLQAICTRGYATSRDELIQGAVAVAAPFFDGPGTVAGSIAVFGPSARLDGPQIDQFGAWLVEQAQALSRVLGYEAGEAAGNAAGITAGKAAGRSRG